MFPTALSFKIVAIAVAVAFAGGGVIGARVMKKIDNGVYYKALAQAKDAKIKALEGQIAARDKAAKDDTERAVKDALERKELEGKSRELENQSSDRVCFDAADTERLRNLWTTGRTQQGRPATRSR